jgi:type IX secretion system PorP/SprF family membrane protein
MTRKQICKGVMVMVSLFIIGNAQAQDPQFSQFYASPIYLNPAFAGSAVCPRMVLNFRDQWPSITGTFVTYSAAYDQHFEKLSGGLGLIFMGDRAGQGTINTNSVSAMYSYKIDVSRKFSMRAALQATYQQKSLDWDKLTFGDMIDPHYGFVYATNEQRPGTVTKGYADFSAGILGYTENFFGGIAVHHLTEPEEGFISISKLPRKLTAHAGYIFDIRRKSRRNRSISDISISPNIMYQQQMKFQQLNYGFYFNRYPFVAGLWFRQNFQNSDAFIILFGVQQESFKFGYTYDLTVSKLTNVTGGAHEISFMYQFKCPDKKRRVRAINCPSF